MSADIETLLAGMDDDDLFDILAQLKLNGDFAEYSRNILKIQTTDGRIAPLVFNKVQLLLNQIFDEIKSERLLRAIILKGRRMGVSTIVSGRYYKQTSSTPNTYAMQITHEPQATDFLFRMVKRFYDFAPEDSRPQTRANNAKLLEFNTKDGKGLNSAFRVATGGKDDVGSGQLIHLLHLSEFAKMAPENIESLMTSVIACVPKTDDSEVIYESTAKGIGGAFYDKFWGARYRIWGKRLDENGEPVIERTINPDAKKDNIETSIFFPWFFFDYDPQGRFKAGPDFEPTKEEQRIKKQFGVTNDQLVWRRFVIHNDYDGSVDRFNQEYPESPEVAFLGTGRPVFDNVKLFKLKEAAPPPIARYEYLHGLNQWVAKDDGRLVVWEEPKPGQHYVIGADVAEGLSKGDFSYAHVTNHQTGKQVAEWHGHIEADHFGEVLFGLGKRYNTAWLGPERNNHGLTTVTWLFNMQYPKIYCEMVPDPPGKPRKRYGWQTSSATRPLIIDHLIGELRDDCHGIMSPHVMQEMMSFKIQDNGRYEADEGQFDDRVMGTAIAKYLRQVIDLPAMKANGNRLDKPTRTISTRKRPNSRGWT